MISAGEITLLWSGLKSHASAGNFYYFCKQQIVKACVNLTLLSPVIYEVLFRLQVCLQERKDLVFYSGSVLRT